MLATPSVMVGDDIDVYARAFEAPGAMRALCEIYRELDHDVRREVPQAGSP